MAKLESADPEKDEEREVPLSPAPLSLQEKEEEREVVVEEDTEEGEKYINVLHGEP